MFSRNYSRNDLWPLQFVVQLTHDRPILRDVQAWVTRHTPPLCTFMPERLRDPNLNVANNSQFRSLSRLLFERQIVRRSLIVPIHSMLTSFLPCVFRSPSPPGTPMLFQATESSFSQHKTPAQCLLARSFFPPNSPNSPPVRHRLSRYRPPLSSRDSSNMNNN